MILKKRVILGQEKKTCSMGPTDRFFAHLQNFFLLKIIVKSAIFRVNFFPKKMQAIFKHFSGHFGKKKF